MADSIGDGRGAVAPAQTQAPASARTSWVLFDFAAQPLYTLIVTFLFAPYFATAVASNPEQGQAWWGYALAVAGVLIAVGSPFLGAAADSGGRKKPWIALFVGIAIAAMASLWFAKPAAGTPAMLLILAAFVIAYMAGELATVFTNAFLPTLVPTDRIGRLSGLGYAVGYAGGLASLLIMAGLIVANPATGKTLLGLPPLLELNLAEREGDRLAGPFAALWLAIFVIPFFLFVPETKPRADRGDRSALAELWSTVKSLPSNPNILLFLVARMVYVDGLTAIFGFGGIYGTTVFGWTAFELGLFGIILSLTGAIGALIGGALDDTRGAKWVIIGSLLLLIAAASGILSVTRTHIFYGLVPFSPRAAGSLPFTSLGEIVYLAFAMVIGFVAAPTQAASRSLVARLAPPDKITQYFGLFAFSGKATAFMAPLLVGVVTSTTGNQRLGVAVIIVFVTIGLLLMLPVRERLTKA